MRDGWDEVPISKVVIRSDERLGTAPEPVILTCTEGAGLIRQSDKFKKRIAAADTSGYKVVRLGDVVYNPYLLWKGAIAQSQYYAPGITSPVYEVLRPRAGVEARFLGLVLCHDAAIRQYDAISIGSIERRRRAVLPEVMKVTIPLPPLAEQRRIVDLIATMDEAAQASSTYLTTVATLIARVREVILANASDAVRLGSLLESIDAGRSPEAEDRQPLPGEAAVLKVSAVRRGRFDPTQVKVLSGTDDFPPRSRLRDGDVLMTRANTRELVGAVCRVLEAPANYYLCDKTLRLNPRLELVDPDYLVEVLLADAARDQIELAATGTSASMKNISQQTIQDLRVPLADTVEQRRLVGTISALRATAAAIELQVASLTSLRGSLLALLLSGSHPIPDSYDRFLDGAA